MPPVAFILFVLTGSKKARGRGMESGRQEGGGGISKLKTVLGGDYEGREEREGKARQGQTGVPDQVLKNKRSLGPDVC